MACKFAPVLIEIEPSAINGVGVFAVTNIAQGQQIAEGVHEEDYDSLVLWTEIRNCSRAVRDKVFAFCVGTPSGFIPPDNLDFNALSVDWYINHSCDGNVGINKRGDFIARRNIKKGEELTYDYGLAESNPRFKMICKCANRKCRKIITGNDWKNDDFRQSNLEYMLPRLRRLPN